MAEEKKYKIIGIAFVLALVAFVACAMLFMSMLA